MRETTLTKPSTKSLRRTRSLDDFASANDRLREKAQYLKYIDSTITLEDQHALNKDTRKLELNLCLLAEKQPKTPNWPIIFSRISLEPSMKRKGQFNTYIRLYTPSRLYVSPTTPTKEPITNYYPDRISQNNFITVGTKQEQFIIKSTRNKIMKLFDEYSPTGSVPLHIIQPYIKTFEHYKHILHTIKPSKPARIKSSFNMKHVYGSPFNRKRVITLCFSNPDLAVIAKVILDNLHKHQLNYPHSFTLDRPSRQLHPFIVTSRSIRQEILKLTSKNTELNLVYYFNTIESFIRGCAFYNDSTLRNIKPELHYWEW